MFKCFLQCDESTNVNVLGYNSCFVFIVSGTKPVFVGESTFLKFLGSYYFYIGSVLLWFIIYTQKESQWPELQIQNEDELLKLKSHATTTTSDKSVFF